MATGFHGFHVIVGTVFLTVCLIRSYKGHFQPRHHFGFAAAAWYWPFVDVVWLFLFLAIYVWGGRGAAYHCASASVAGWATRGGPSQAPTVNLNNPTPAPPPTWTWF